MTFKVNRNRDSYSSVPSSGPEVTIPEDQVGETRQTTNFRKRGNVLLTESNHFYNFLSYVGCTFDSFKDHGSACFWKFCSICVVLMSTAANIYLFKKFYLMSKSEPITDVDIIFICGKAMNNTFRNFKFLAFIIRHNSQSFEKKFLSKTWTPVAPIRLEPLPKSSISGWFIGFGCIVTSALALNIEETNWSFHKLFKGHQLYMQEFVGQPNEINITQFLESQIQPADIVIGTMGGMTQLAFHLTEFYFVGMFFVYVSTMVLMTDRLLSMARSAYSTTGPPKRVTTAYKDTFSYCMGLVAFSSVIEESVGDIYLHLHIDVVLSLVETLRNLMIRRHSIMFFANVVRIILVLVGYQLAVGVSEKIAYFRTWVTDRKTFKILYSGKASALMRTLDQLNQNPPGVGGGIRYINRAFIAKVFEVVSVYFFLWFSNP